LRYDPAVVSLNNPSLVTDIVAANDPLQVALKGTLSLKAFGTGQVYIDGITEGLVPNRQFKLTFKGWKAADYSTTATSAVQLIVYYKNTYSVISFFNFNLITIAKDVTPLTANHPEFWDVYKTGAHPVLSQLKPRAI
jgi:hypothetical protein